MLKKLQRKFVFFTTLISIVVMLLIAVGINIINYNSVMAYSDEVLSVLASDNFEVSQKPPPHLKFPAEFAFTTRFFIVNVDANGEFNYIDTKNISSVSTDEAKLYASEISKSELSIGTIDNFRYIKTENGDSTAYIFLDIEKDLIDFERYMLYSVLIVSVALFLIFILSCLLSKKVVYPIIEGYEKQKRFITDVSHEFKTPLTIIRADCDVIELDNGEGEWTDSIKSQILRLNTLVENLISLTKLDEDKTKILKTDFSLSDTVKDTIAEFAAAIKNNNLEFNVDITKNISYKGDEAFIRKLISILIENAIKYSNGYLNITLKATVNKKMFIIENSCEEITVGKHNSWFERFYRDDKSRNSQIKGFGIGLSIAKAICDRHDAKIIAESKTGKEIIITVIF